MIQTEGKITLITSQKVNENKRSRKLEMRTSRTNKEDDRKKIKIKKI